MADPATSTDTRSGDPDGRDPGEVRAALIDQLRYLIDEVEALKAVVDRVPSSVREGRPTPDALSMKEIYGVIARRDEHVHRPRLERIAGGEDGDAPHFAPVDDASLAEDEDWNAEPIHDILDRLQSTRRALVALLDDLPAPAWARTARIGGEVQNVYEIAYRIAQDDAERLRTLGRRLHEANLTERSRDLPK